VICAPLPPYERFPCRSRGDKSRLITEKLFNVYRRSDLIVNSRGNEVGLALMIPMGEYHSVWARFPVQAN
jgi:hypothetical protein